MILVDSNVWIHYLDAGLDPHPTVRGRLPEILAEDDALVPTVVQMEVLHYVARTLEDPGGTVDNFLAFPGQVHPLTSGDVIDASRILLDHRDEGIGGRDAALLVAARAHDATLATSDRALIDVAERIDVPAIDPTA